MDWNALSDVKFGDVESLNVFLFENGIQHRLFQKTFEEQGILVPIFPIMDADTNNLDDWLQAHQVEHQAFSQQLNLGNPFNLLDVDFNNESAFYDWVANHYYIHQQIAAALNLSS